MLLWLSAVGPLGAVYAAIAYMRIYQMATRLPGYLPAFPVLVAVLFAGVAVGLLGLITYWESSRSFLREDTEHAITIDNKTTIREHSVRSAIAAHLDLGERLHAQAEDLLTQAHALRSRGIEQVRRAFQGISVVCNLPEVVEPNQDFLFQYDDPHAKRAREILMLAGTPEKGC